MYETVANGSCSKLGLRDVRIDGAIQGGKCCAQAWWGLRGEAQVERLESGPQDASVDFGEEERDAPEISHELAKAGAAYAGTGEQYPQDDEEDEDEE